MLARALPTLHSSSPARHADRAHKAAFHARQDRRCCAAERKSPTAAVPPRGISLWVGVTSRRPWPHMSSHALSSLLTSSVFLPASPTRPSPIRAAGGPARRSQEGRQDRPLHGELPRHRAGRRQALFRALPRHPDRDRARADRPLITRIKTEAAANRMIADVIDISDRAQARGMVELFAPYAPPNAADYPAVARTADRLWPRSGNAWTITYNSELVKDPPKSWADLVKPEFGKQHLGQTVVAVRRRTVQPRHVRTQGDGRGLLGEAGGAQADAVSEPGPDGRCHDPRRDRDRAAGHQSRHSARRARRAAQVVLRAGGRAGHGLLCRDRQGRRPTPTPQSCFSTGRCRAKARR